MELDWPYKRHYEIFAGIRDYAEENGGWRFDLGNFPQFGNKHVVQLQNIVHGKK